MLKFGLITNSFGNYLALRAIEKSTNIKAVIMLNPIPFTFIGWKSGLTTIINKVPEKTLNQLGTLATKPDSGIELFRTIYPYYTGNENSILPMDITFDMQACNTIAAKVMDFDDRDLIKSTSVPLIRIAGEQDPFFDDKEMLPNQTFVISNAGHYPFFETPAKFSEALNKTEEFLCR